MLIIFGLFEARRRSQWTASMSLQFKENKFSELNLNLEAKL